MCTIDTDGRPTDQQIMTSFKRSNSVFWLAVVAGIHTGFLVFYACNYSVSYSPQTFSSFVKEFASQNGKRVPRHVSTYTDWNSLTDRQVQILNCSGLDVSKEENRVPVNFNVVS